MPHGKKNKFRACEKRCQARGEGQGLKGAQATAGGEEESPLSPSVVSEGTLPSSPDAGTPQKYQRASSSPAATVSCASSGEGAKSQREKSPSSSSALPSSESSSEDPLASKVSMLVQVLVHKYKMKEPITKEEMLKIINKKYKVHFPEILQRATEHMELAFGLDLKEVDPSRHCYILISKMDHPNEESPSDDSMDFPKNGILMPLLGMIFFKGNRATEEETWEFLNMMGLYAGRSHFIFGEPRKLITTDLVKEKFLEYRQVPNSDPPCYEFLWGPKAHAETSKMKVLEFWAKINNIVPSAFPTQYEEALRDEEEGAQARAAARAHSRAMTSSSSKHW